MAGRPSGTHRRPTLRFPIPEKAVVACLRFVSRQTRTHPAANSGVSLGTPESSRQRWGLMKAKMLVSPIRSVNTKIRNTIPATSSAPAPAGS